MQDNGVRQQWLQNLELFDTNFKLCFLYSQRDKFENLSWELDIIKSDKAILKGLLLLDGMR